MPVMYDAIYPYTIPVGSIPTPDFVAGYVDGYWPSLAGMRLRYPAAVAVSITAIPGSPGSANADVCDCENGDYTNAQAAAWAKARFVAGFAPCLYTSESNWPALKAAVGQAGVDPDLVDWWIAGYPGSAGAWQLYPGSVAHQFVDRGPYDESVVVDGWVPGRPLRPPAPAPVPAPAPAPVSEEDLMLSDFVSFRPGQVDLFGVVEPGGIVHWWSTDGGATWGKEVLCGPIGGKALLNGKPLVGTFTGNVAVRPIGALMAPECLVVAKTDQGKTYTLIQGQAAAGNGWTATEIW